MAFINKFGKKKSYDCKNLIEELKSDIAEFGGNLLLEVITEESDGVKIYKDYNFIDNDKSTDFNLSPGEKTEKITASALLEMYEIENEIL